MSRFLLALLALSAPRANAASVTFDNECGTKNWFSTCGGGRTNWDPDMLPGQNDDVTIDAGKGPASAGAGGGSIIRLKSLKAPGGLKIGAVDLSLFDPSEVHGLEWFDTLITSAALGSMAGLTLTGTSVCGTNGAFQGLGGMPTGAATILRNAGSLNVVGLCLVNGARLENASGGQVTQRSQLTFHPNASAVNDGTWILNNNNSNLEKFTNNEPDTATFVNNSVLRNAGGLSTVALAFESDPGSRIEIQAGQLYFKNRTSFDGEILIGGGARLVAGVTPAGIVQQFGSDVRVSGEGELSIEGWAGGQHVVQGDIRNYLGSLGNPGRTFLHGVAMQISGSLYNFGTISWGDGESPAGSVFGSGRMVNEGSNAEKFGFFRSGTARGQMPLQGRIVIRAAARLGAVLFNNGLVEQSATLTIEGDALPNQIAVYNEAAGTWILNGANTFSGQTGTFVRRIQNLGMVLAPKVGQLVVSSSIEVPFDVGGTGALRVESGHTVGFRRGGVWSGRHPLQVDGTVALRAPISSAPTSYLVRGDSEFIPYQFDPQAPPAPAVGSVDVEQSATLRIEGSLTNRINLRFLNGAASGPGTLQNEQVLVVEQGGALGSPADALSVTNRGLLTVKGGSNVLRGTLVNRAVLSQDERRGLFIEHLGNFTVEGSSTIENEGRFVMLGSSTIFGTGRIVNEARFWKGLPPEDGAVRGGTATVHVRFDNRESVRVLDGILEFAGGVEQIEGDRLLDGRWFVEPGATLRIQNAKIRTIGPNAQVEVADNSVSGTAFEGLVRVEGRLTVFSQRESDRIRAGEFSVGPGGAAATRRDVTPRRRELPREGGSLPTAGRALLRGVEGAAVPVPQRINFDLDGGPFVNEGAVVPGEVGAVAPFGIDGDYTQTATGVLRLDVGSEEHDQLYITGAATLGGALEVGFLDGFMPAPEDAIVAVLAGSITGRFANAAARLVTDEGSFEVTYTGTSVILSGFEPGPPTPTPTAGGTTTRTPGTGSCTGDCDADLKVTIAELVRGVNIALGRAPASSCPGFGAGTEGEATIDQLIAAVGAALRGC